MGAAVVLLWGAATLLGLGVAATTRIGPVLFTVTDSHGVHLGDLVAFAAAYCAALVITHRVLARRSSRAGRGGPAAEAPPAAVSRAQRYR